ncbi:amidohydrolase family protein [Roseomonas sp. HF4]|uniref:amidohydrolase family protein n=1 Tax=Roseomonas sp. HF4 TaxID=2562313 RepID=UPI00148565AC|nr:amidohydrolase family protein [Roseomonas sp. HF4]
MPAPILIRDAAWAVVWDASARGHAYARGMDVLLEGGRVAAIARHDPDAPVPPGAEVVDGRRLMVMPGLVNIHTHPTSALPARGVREDHGVPEQQMTGLFERLQAFRIDQAGQAAGMRLAYAEMMSAGVTSVVDLSQPFPDWLGIMRDSGLRVWAGPGFADAHWGMAAPQTVTWMWNRENGRTQFEAAKAVMKEAEADPSGRLHGIVFPAQIDTVDEEMLREAAAHAGESGRPFTTHIAQAVVEVREMIRRHGTTPIQWAAAIGLLGPRSILGHAIFVDEHSSIGWHTARDIGLVAEHGATVAHCPTPFALYGEHLQHFGKYRARGVNMGFGTDCAPHNLIEEMRLAVILARGVARDVAAADTGSVFHAATAGGADALGRPDLGRLAKGAAADVVLVDLAHPLMSPPRDPLRALLFHAADRAVKRVIVGGETVFADGRPTRLDVAEAAGILAEAQARMLRDAKGRDYRGRSGDEICPVALPMQ